jgi:ATP-binding cassette, subfamily F, member 3
VPTRSLLEVRNLSKSYGDKNLFTEASVVISEKQKIGVIGRNGAGKTTFFKMVLGDIEPDSGEILKMPHLRLGYIEQNDPFLPGETVQDFLERYTGKPSWECAKVAGQFQLKGDKLTGQVSDLSGGFQMRVKLTATLLFEPNLLLLDEPTNYLDLSTLILLENFLRNFKGAFMVITHDREFVKRTCNEILDVEHGQLFLHPEPLEEYLEYKSEREALAQSVNTNIERKQKQLQTFVSRFGAKANFAKSAQSKMKQIDRLDNQKISIVSPFSKVRMYIPKVEGRLGFVLQAANLDIGYEHKLVARKINLDIERGSKLAILGDNGQGKSTLLKTLVGHLAPLNGRSDWKSGVRIAYYHQHVAAGLNLGQNIWQYIKSVADETASEDVMYRILGNFLFTKKDYDKKLEVLSGGEKARLYMAGMFLSKADVYLLDEPTNHLDFETVEALGQALSEFNGTVVVISHDRTFVNLMANQIVELKNGRARKVLGSYEQYVWQLEQELNPAENSAPDSIQDPFKNSSALQTDKARRVRLYELNKEVQKIERKIKSLQELIGQGQEVVKNQAILADKEVSWLEISHQIDELKAD